MTWEPQPEGLQQIITILKESQSPDTATQRTVQLVSLFLFIHLFLVGQWKIKIARTLHPHLRTCISRILSALCDDLLNFTSILIKTLS